MKIQFNGRHIYSIVLSLFSILCFCGNVFGNNIRIVTVPEVTKKNDSIAAITFTIAWDNSWKTSKPANHDAAWIYVKCWDGDKWNHAYLKDEDHTPGNPHMTEYRVENRKKTNKKCPMAIHCGKSMVYKKWHVNPAEDSVTGVVGVFLYRKDTLGEGDVMVPGVTLLWNYKDQGFNIDDDLVVKVFAVEMVYVPQGAFYMGGVGNAANQPYSVTTNGATFGSPAVITSENPLEFANTTDANTIWFSGVTANIAGTLEKTFPKGYQAFYCMKYELTQEAYCDFLNALQSAQQDGRINATLSSLAVNHSYWSTSATALNSYRNYIKVSKAAPVYEFGVDASQNNKYNETVKVQNRSGDECEMSSDGQDLALNFASMRDLLAYADFAGLRPMTEMEYEKACRGTKASASDEYAWGIHTLTHFNAVLGQIQNVNLGNECLAAAYNCGAAHISSTSVYSGSTYNRYDYSAPLRVGCFADSTSSRVDAGASFWGIMNMSDNCSETCISIGGLAAATFAGRAFEGVHGDGQLLPNGDADVRRWNISDLYHYYIPRGMRYPSTQNVRQSGSTTNNGINNGQVLTDGMVSNRAMAGHGQVGTTRVYVQWMSGIRCVRTEITND